MRAKVGKMSWQALAAIVIRFASAALGFALVVVLARWMSTDEFGRFAFAFSLATTLALVLDVGQRRFVLRHLAAYRGRGRIDLFVASMRFSLSITVAAAILGGGALAIVAFALDRDLALLPAAALTSALILSEFQSYALRGLSQVIRALVPREIVWRPLSIGILAVLGSGLTIVTNAATALWILAATLLALTLLQFVFVGWPAWKKAKTKFVEGSKTDPDPEETVATAKAKWIASSRRFWIMSAINESLSPLSVVIVGLFVSPAENGAFFGAVRMAAVIAFPLQALNLVVSPSLAKAYASENRENLQKVAVFTAAVASLFAIVGALILAFFGSDLLALMDPAFRSAETILLIIVCGYVVGALCGSSGTLMTMTGHEKEFLMILIWSSLIGIGSLFGLGALYGGLGAAVGLLISKSLSNVWVVVWARRNIDLDPSIFGVARHFRLVSRRGSNPA